MIVSSLADVPSVPVFAFDNDIVLSKDTLADVAVIFTLPLSCDIPVIVTVFPLSVAVIPAPLDEDITYCEVLSVTPSNTCISVVPPTNDAMLPLVSAGNVWDSFVNNAVTASVPSVPSEPGWIPNNVNESVDITSPADDCVNTLTS